MFNALRIARPAFSRSQRAIASTSIRSFSLTARRLSDHGPPQLYGPGAKNPDGIPSDEEQSTGLERFQLLGKMEGIDVFDMKPLDASRLGTLAEPIKVPSLFPERLVGCTGFPADSHDTVWLNVNTNRSNHRCPECGSVYALDFQGSHEEHHHH